VKGRCGASGSQNMSLQAVRESRIISDITGTMFQLLCLRDSVCIGSPLCGSRGYRAGRRERRFSILPDVLLQGIGKGSIVQFIQPIVIQVVQVTAKLYRPRCVEMIAPGSRIARTLVIQIVSVPPMH